MVRSFDDVRQFFRGETAPAPAEAPDSEDWAQRLIGSSPAVRRIRELVRLLAIRRTTVLLTGETGTGKEAVARALSEAGNRKGRPFVAVNCAAVPETLFESELFGHAKGAFTGATSARPGLFELADGGTLFLDEIGDMPLHLQGKLLRVLQEREIRRIGESTPVPVDCRVVAASNVDLSVAVREKKFREDLLYRLSVVKVNIPPLRTRMEDVPVLVQHFLDGVCRREDLEPRDITDQALNHLMAHSWPGNVRQLEHAVESAVVLAGDRRLLDCADFPLDGHEPFPTEASHRLRPMSEAGVDLEDMVRRMQLHYLNQALQLSGGNKSRAADLLGLRRTTLLYKARQLGCAMQA